MEQQSSQNNKSLFQGAKDLNFPMGSYALFGSAPLGIRGLRECRDVDIIVTKDLWEKCKIDGWEVKESDVGPYLYNANNSSIEVWNDWHPGKWDLEKLIKEAEIIDGLPFVRLQQVLEWKKLKRKEKDLKDIELIEKFIKK